MKSKNSYKQFAAKRKREGEGRRRLLWVSAAALMFFLSGYFIFQHFRADAHTSPLSLAREKFSDWMSEHRSKPERKQPTERVAKASKAEAEPRIHFEFYKTLPAAQMAGATATKPSISNNPMIANAEQLERELLEAAQGKN